MLEFECYLDIQVESLDYFVATEWRMNIQTKKKNHTGNRQVLLRNLKYIHHNNIRCYNVVYIGRIRMHE